ncbi:MAG: two-component regulator propeller domain-containing protein [Actinomycetota bacterium]
MRIGARRGRVRVAVVVGLVLAAGCSAGTSGGDDETTSTTPTISVTSPAVTTTSETGATTTSEPVTSTTIVETVGPDSGENVAWMAGFGCGASALAEGATWYTLREEYGTLSTDQVMDIVVGEDGTAWVATSTGVQRIAGGVMTAAYDEGLDALAVDPISGDVWGVSYQQAVRYDGSSWTNYPSANFGEGEFVDLLKDVTVDGGGHPWVATTSTVATLQGDQWTWWGADNGFPASQYPYYLESIIAAADGRIWVSTTDGVLVFDGSTWTMTDPGVSQPKRISAAADGRVFVASWADGFATYEGGSWRVTQSSPGGLPTGRVRAIEVDSRGRTWVGTTWGFSVVEGGVWTTYTMATSGLAGNCVEALAIHGGGPPDMPAPIAPVTGSLTGAITVGGAPLANASVVLCSDQPSMIYGGATPCSGYPFESVVTTDAEGRFTFADVPIGDYDLAWQVEEGTWRSFLFGGEIPHVRPGLTTELETIESESD